MAKKKLPKFLQPCLWSYDLEKMDIKDDKETIITQVLNFGNVKSVKWLLKTYPEKDIIETVRYPQRGSWTKETLNYWLKMLEIKIPKIIKLLAIQNIFPNKKLYDPKNIEKYARYIRQKKAKSF